MLFIVWSRLNLVGLILNYLILVSIEIVCFNSSPRFCIIWLIISLVILNNYLVFHLGIVEILLLLMMLPAVEWSTLMHIPLMLMTHGNRLLILLIMVLVWWKTNVDIHEILWSLLLHLILFCQLLLLLIYSHLLLNLLLLLIMLLWLNVVEILLSHCLLLLRVVLLVSIIISWVLAKILVIYIRLIWYKVLMILLWSDIIVNNLMSFRIWKNLLFVELIVNLDKILHIREFSRFLHMLAPLPFWLWILDLEVIVVHEVFLVIDGVVIILSSFWTIVPVIFLKKTLNHQFWWVIIRWLLNVGKLILTIIEDYLLHLLVITHFSGLCQNFISLRNFFNVVGLIY